ncbi:MAG: HAD-IC family P-type ATPase [bacterium]|nr:HAD-IC family P-type ATPase [bacterium]
MEKAELNDLKFWSLSAKDVLAKLKSDANGLTDQEIKARAKQFGKNEIEKGKRLSRTRIFLRQFQSPIIYILLIAAAVTLALQDYKDASFILIAAFINAGLGFYQENKAEDALEKLKSYIDEKALVRRNGREFKISTKDLLPGDIILLKSGSKVSADARLLSLNDLYADEAILTGESLAQKKTIEAVPEDTDLGDRTGCVFAGTVITQGYASAAVTSIGENTELGKIAHLVSKAEDEKTPLQKALYSLSIKASAFVIGLAILIFFIANSSGTPFLESFLISVAVLVAAVPEGLPIVMTIILATGVQRLAKKNGIVRKLNAAETLGSTSVILTDKTGTLTQAKMTLDRILPFHEGESKKDFVQSILEMALLNCDVNIENPTDDASNWKLNGKSLEKALVKESAIKHRVFLPDILKEKTQHDFLPFNSKAKFSASLYSTSLPSLTGYFKNKNLKLLTVLGAPEVLIQASSHSDKEKQEFLKTVERLAYDGARVVALGYKDQSHSKNVYKILPESLKGIKLMGVLAFKDPVKPGVSVAMQEVAQAGVRTIIVTGDHTGTAVAVAKEIGMSISSNEELLEGHHLDSLSDKSLQEAVKKIKIVSRVSPEGKMRLAKALQANGEIVAMNGDGVNDAPAIKQADIGIAMGSGTDVAKQASDLVLLDDNYETIVEAIKEGHRIVQNIRKALVYLTSTILDEVILIGASIVGGLALPFNALQILWVNFFADSFPGISLAFENKIDAIERHPTKIQSGLFTKKMKFLLFVNGTISSVLLLALYLILLNINIPTALAQTVTFAAFGSYSLILVLGLRSLRRSIFSYNPFSNQALNMSLLIGFGLVAISIYAPFFQNLFGTVAISPFWVMVVLLFGILNILLIELSKLIYKNEAE